ncbi:MAG: cell division protein FtsZ [Candidatus Methanomethylophilaceae archaeon]|nr:cell division protein FtsZ [Candidatus Methanomethylophilaceae archaeon]MBP5685046.1 cell division protein FtsZ [Candidatus Methanomethylophilaceae archaeon]MBP5735292.1 cell division protein FtsZ [Candidatus Methanomethylophilaceae archaeon]
MVYNTENKHKVAIVGVGGAGCNFVSAFTGRCDMDTIAINTDKEALHASTADRKIYICKGVVLHGEGAKGDAKLGMQCADIHIEEIREALAGYEKAFIVAGLGGGTGTGATPVVIEAAQSQNVMTFAIAIKPFSFEGSRVEVAKDGFGKIRAVCPYAAAIGNDIIISKMSDMTMEEAYSSINSVIMAHIEACVAEYPQNNDRDVTEECAAVFDNFMQKSPIADFINA